MSYKLELDTDETAVLLKLAASELRDLSIYAKRLERGQDEMAAEIDTRDGVIAELQAWGAELVRGNAELEVLRREASLAQQRAERRLADLEAIGPAPSAPSETSQTHARTQAEAMPCPRIDLMPCGCARIISSTDPMILPLTTQGFEAACERQRKAFVIAEPGDFVMANPTRSGVLLDGPVSTVLGNVSRNEVRERAKLLVLCKAPGGEVVV